MGSKRAPTFDLFGNNTGIACDARPYRRNVRGPAFAPPPSFISVLALSMIIGSGSALASPPGSCNSTGTSLTCTGSVTNPSAFSPAGDFTVDIGTTTPTDVPAHIQQTAASQASRSTLAISAAPFP